MTSAYALLKSNLAEIILLFNLLMYIFPRHAITEEGVVTIVSVSKNKSKGKKLKGKKHQHCHVDYNKRRIFNQKLMIPGITAPLVCLFALQDDTKIVLYNKDGSFKIIDIPKGSMFIMAGDCLHGGLSYIKTNARLHWYMEARDLTTSKNEEAQNEQGWMEWCNKDKEWKPIYLFRD